MAAPTVTIVIDDTSLAIGQTATITFTFSEAVTGFNPGDVTAANGTRNGFATVDNIVWTATFTPHASVTDTTNVISVDMSGVADAATGTNGSGITNSNNYAIDTDRPTATVVVADTALAIGETSLVTVTFSEAVTGFTNADLTIANGALTTVSSSDGGTTWTATLTPAAAMFDTTNIIALNRAGVSDAAGNIGIGTTNSNNYVVDTTVAPPPPPPANLRGSSAADTIVGNDLNNTIAAGDANDTASGGLGSDSISGDAGDDVLQGNIGADSVAGGIGADIVHGGQGDDRVQGNAGNDHVSGDKGSDTVHGGQGDDQVLGGDGNDYLSGDRGSDTVTGGLGADLFHTWGGAGVDFVTDFNLAHGDRVMLDVGTVYTLAQVGADTVIDMEGGGRMILAGIQLSTLTPGWIFTG